MTDEIAEGDLEEEDDADDNVEDDLTTEPDTEEDQVVLTQFTDDFQPFTEFPEPVLLKKANDVYTTYEKPVPRDEDGTVAAYPCPSWKEDVFNLAGFTELDVHAVEVRDVVNIYNSNNQKRLHMSGGWVGVWVRYCLYKTPKERI